METTFSFTASVWLYPGMAGWHFITLPVDIAQDINYLFSHQKRGWGSLRVAVTVGNTMWNTSIFSDKKTSSYLLPLKADIRKKEHIQIGKTYSFNLQVL